MHFWKQVYGMPIFWYDPAPELGRYINQRALLNAFPRPVRWFPPNWIFASVASLISFLCMAWNALRGEER